MRARLISAFRVVGSICSSNPLNYSQILLRHCERKLNRYLSVNRQVTKKALASLAQTTEQTIGDFLGKRERGLKAETYARLSFIVNNGVVPSSNRIAGLQENGRKVGKSMELYDANMTATYARHNDQYFKLMNESRHDRNIGTFQTNHYGPSK